MDSASRIMDAARLNASRPANWAERYKVREGVCVVQSVALLIPAAQLHMP
ncbi:unnamed protein product [Toxocara canis]|uniref:Uncharacterized protein n=1 Tax=Toxocara canis TaxID=6265 RepID=A0A3P7GRS6_TOXCA|nr:unnamed protein product [Toxocara canis]